MRLRTVENSSKLISLIGQDVFLVLLFAALHVVLEPQICCHDETVQGLWHADFQHPHVLEFLDAAQFEALVHSYRAIVIRRGESALSFSVCLFEFI